MERHIVYNKRTIIGINHGSDSSGGKAPDSSNCEATKRWLQRAIPTEGKTHQEVLQHFLPQSNSNNSLCLNTTLRNNSSE
jgi:hypothetical protein